MCDALSTMAAQMEEAMESACEPQEIAAILLKGVLYVRLKQVAVIWKEGPGPGGTLCQRGRRRH